MLQADMGFKELKNLPIFGGVLSSLGNDCTLLRPTALYLRESQEATEEELTVEPPSADK